MNEFDVDEECPHCDEPHPSQQMDTHVATTHADLPPCTARIGFERGLSYDCAFRAGHDKGEHGKWHASRRGGELWSRYVWNDSALGATPHRPHEPDQQGADEGRPEPPSDDELNSVIPVRPDPRQPAYDAVYEYIRGLGDYLPRDSVHRNAIIWRAVRAALDATPVGRCVSSHCVEGDHILDLGESP